MSVRRSYTVPSRVWRQRLGRDTGFGASTQVSLTTPSRARSIAVRTFPAVRPIPVTGMLRTLTARNAEEFESIYQYKRPLLLTAPNAVDLDAWQASTQRLLAQPQPVSRARRRLQLEKLLPALADCNVMIGTSDGIVENGGKGCVWLCAHRAAPSC